MGRAEFRFTADGLSAIGQILYKGMLVEFLVDAADVERIKDKSWHMASNSYIATSLPAATAADLSANSLPPTPPRRREVYLHYFLLQPSPNQAVQHISKNGLDNRRANLKIVDAAKAQALAAAAANSKKKRIVELPPMCGIKAVEIPRHIWYVQANGYHRDRFAIEFKSEGILWKSTSSKRMSLQEKLDQAKSKLQEIYQAHPHLDTSKDEELAASLQASFEAALGSAGALGSAASTQPRPF